MNYIHEGRIVSFNFELDAKYNVGSNWDDATKGKFVKLTTEQEEFYLGNPNATINEIFNAAISPTPAKTLEEVKQEKYSAIEDQDRASGQFYVVVSGVKIPLWIDKDTRNSLLNITLPALKSEGETTTKLWAEGNPPQSITVPITWAEEKLPLLEVYAKQTYDLKLSYKAMVYNCTTIEEVNAIDVTANYPTKLEFTL